MKVGGTDFLFYSVDLKSMSHWSRRFCDWPLWMMLSVATLLQQISSQNRTTGTVQLGCPVPGFTGTFGKNLWHLWLFKGPWVTKPKNILSIFFIVLKDANVAWPFVKQLVWKSVLAQEAGTLAMLHKAQNSRASFAFFCLLLLLAFVDQYK